MIHSPTERIGIRTLFSSFTQSSSPRCRGHVSALRIFNSDGMWRLTSGDLGTQVRILSFASRKTSLLMRSQVQCGAKKENSKNETAQASLLESQRKYLASVVAGDAIFSRQALPADDGDDSMIWKITRIPDPTPHPLKSGKYYIRNVRNGDINIQRIRNCPESAVVSSSKPAVVRGVSFLLSGGSHTDENFSGSSSSLAVGTTRSSPPRLLLLDNQPKSSTRNSGFSKRRKRMSGSFILFPGLTRICTSYSHDVCMDHSSITY